MSGKNVPSDKIGRRAVAAMLWAAIMLAAGAPAAAQAVAIPSTAPAGVVSEKDVQACSAKAVAFLYAKQDPQGCFPNPHSREYVGGGEALAALALLRAGQAPDNAKLKKTLLFLNVIQPGQTYTRALRAMVYSLLPGNEYQRRLGEDVQWLTKQQHRSGGWGYGPGSAMATLRPEWVDASNTQFALLALREASDAGMVISTQALRQAEFFFRQFQNADGGWGYQPKLGEQPPQRPLSHGSMTAAGAASYFIFADKLATGPGGAATAPAFADRIQPAIGWLTANYSVDRVPKYVWVEQPSQLYYYLFCLQRVGDAAGLWAFGRNDYCAQIAQLLRAQQKPNGSWNDSITDTCFALLALLKARAPVAINRLQWADDPGPDPRDAANVARWLTREWNTQVAWRAVRPNEPDHFAACPLLYLHHGGSTAPPDALGRQLASHITDGGTVLIQADSPQAASALADFFKRLFPRYEAKQLPPDHPVFSLRFAIDQQQRPPITGLGEVCRTRVFILAQDVSGAWHQGQFRQRPQLFGLAGNVVLYANGGRIPPGKFVRRPTPAAPPPVRKHIPIARLKYPGDYDVCQQAIRRLSDTLAHSLPLGLKELPPADASQPIPAAVIVLWLTGNKPPSFSDAEKANLRSYLEAGGTLLIDPASGRQDFREAALALLKDILGPSGVAEIKPDHPLITGDFAGGVGADLAKVALLPTPDKPAPARLYAGTLNGRIAAVLSHHGLTWSIEGTPAVENLGYLSEDAKKVALNVILYAAAQKPAATAQPPP